MKEVPFPVARARTRRRAPTRPAKAGPKPAFGAWKAPDPFHVSVEERRRALLRERPVLFWNGQGEGRPTSS